MVIGIFLMVISPILAFYEMVCTKQLANFIDSHNRSTNEVNSNVGINVDQHESIIVSDQNDLPSYDDITKSSPIQLNSECAYPRRLNADTLSISSQGVSPPSYQDIVCVGSIHSKSSETLNETTRQVATISPSSQIHSM